MSDGYEIWLRTVCFQKPTPEAYELAKYAWREGRRHGQGDTVMAKPITVDQAKRILAEAGMVAVPVSVVDASKLDFALAEVMDCCIYPDQENIKKVWDELTAAAQKKPDA